MTYSYFGDWITCQPDRVTRGDGGANHRLDATLILQKRLVAISEAKPQFDILVRRKPLAQQPVGKEPDVGDGMRLNVRSFMAPDTPGGRKGIRLLRTKPNVHWRKDRGKDRLTLGKRSKPPWLQDDDCDPTDDTELWAAERVSVVLAGPRVSADRVNDVHLDVAFKSTHRRPAAVAVGSFTTSAPCFRIHSDFRC